MNQLPTLAEINETPLAFITEMIEADNLSYTIMMYGPYLVKNYTEEFWKRMKDIKNDLVRFFAVMGSYDRLTRGEYTFAHAKDKILYMIKNYSDGAYHDIITREGIHLIDDIRNYQKQTKNLESAMLNYAPIVGYGPTILAKPEMESETPGNATPNDIDERIQSLIRTKYYDIIQNSDLCFKGESIEEDIETIKANIPEHKDVCLYYIYVYMRFGTAELFSTSGSMEFYIKQKTIDEIING